MVITAATSSDKLDHAVFASRYVRSPLPRFALPKKQMPKDVAYQIIRDVLMMDGNPRLNLASFVTSWMEPECDKLILESLSKNYIDMDEYPVTVQLQDRCVNMIARLFHAPLRDGEQAVGVSTVGSSEAIMLAGLAFKRSWQNKRKSQHLPFDKPNIVTGANVHVCWEKFCRYFEVEMKVVKLKEGSYIMNPLEAVQLVDTNTICVCATMGSTMTGEFEDVELLNRLLEEKNQKIGWDTPIHVDAATGGFVAPFLYPELPWDFRLPLVKSINVSGHKYGLVYPGIGWIIWRSYEHLPEDLIFHVNYLGADQPTFTLNFSRGASQLIAQYYQFIRLGFKGYKAVIQSCANNADYLKERLMETGMYEVVSKAGGVPMVAFSVKKEKKKGVMGMWLDEEEIVQRVRKYGWILSVYRMSRGAADHHRSEDEEALVKVVRVVVRESFDRAMAERLVDDLQTVIESLLHEFASLGGDSVAAADTMQDSKVEVPSLMKELFGKSSSAAAPPSTPSDQTLPPSSKTNAVC